MDKQTAAKRMKEVFTVPAIPLPMAITCCVLNFLIPGLGTMLAGFSSMWYAKDDVDTSLRWTFCCISLMIGFLQQLFVFVFLIGWIWSCVWGLGFLGMSSEYYHKSAPPVVSQKAIPSILIQAPIQDEGTGYVTDKEYGRAYHRQNTC